MRSNSLLPRRRRPLAVIPVLLTLSSAAALAAQSGASAAGPLLPQQLLVSTSQWQQDAPVTMGTTQLPPNCGTRSNNPCKTAVAPGTYPLVFNNDSVDGSFGVTEPIVLEELNPATNAVLTTVTVPNSLTGTAANGDQLVTSFPSKSEIALNQSTDGSSVGFMGYVAPVGALDVSNSDTAGAVDTTNSAGTTPYYRAVAALDALGNYTFTETNAYSGNNGRASILNSALNTIYTAGNAGNGKNPEPQGVVLGVGTQILAPANAPESAQTPGAPTPLGNFNITQLGKPADKSAKDDNFRGLAINGNVVYFSKGSGGNGVDTVYYLDTVGGTCPNGTGVPAGSATLPQAGTFPSPTYSNSNAALGLSATNPGLVPTNSCIVNGFPTALATGANNTTDYPFGIWFANPTTMYVADEGSGDATYNTTSNTYSNAATSTTAGLQKWTLNTATNTWSMAYVLQSGLGLGTPTPVANDSHGNVYPTGNNTTDGGKGGPWTPGTDGLRNLTGRVNQDGTVSIWAVTSTVSGNGDQGADPNQLVSITDNVAATTLPATESFSTVIPATYGQVVRGVSFTPSGPAINTPEAPWAPLLPLAAGVVGIAIYVSRRRGAATA